MTQPDADNAVPSDTDLRVSEAIRKHRIHPNVATYGYCWDAINRLAPTHTPEELVTAAIHLAVVAKEATWAIDDWKAYVPAISQLLELAHLLPAATNNWSVPGQEVSHLPIYASLRIHTNSHRYDHHMRALLVSISARISSPDFSARSELAHQAPSAIETLRTWITGLRDTPVRDKRGALVMAEAIRDSHSAADLAVAVALRHLDGPERKRKDLTYALTIWVPQVLGIGRLSETSNDQKVIADPQEPEPSIVVSRIRSPLADPIDQPEDKTEDSVDIISFKPANTARTQPLRTHDLLREAKRASKMQRISSPGDHFSHLHHAALLPGETKVLAKALMRELNQKNPDIFLSGAYYLIALTLCTGLTVDRILRAIERTPDNVLPKITTKKLHLSTLLPLNSFKPPPDTSGLFVDTSDFLEIPLPPTITTALSNYRFLKNRTVMQKAKNLIGMAIRQLRVKAKSELLTLGRIRKTYAVLIHESSWNYPATAILSQDSFSQSDAPLYYYQAGSEILANIYARAIWTIFGDTTPPLSDDGKRIGSRALPTAWCTKEFARKPSAAIHQKLDIREPYSVANAHNAIALNLTAILQSVGGHRPNNSIFTLTRWDFSVDHKAAIVADKQSDPAHARRLIGLGSMGARQLHLYLKHLEALADLEPRSELSIFIKKVKKGREPLIFQLDSDAKPAPATMEWFRSCLSKAPDIPLNHGRHVLASLGRQMDRTRSDLMGIHLGHYESTGFPFSAESPLVPISYLRRLNPLLDNIFKNQGWRLCCGLADPKEKHRKLEHCATVDWSQTGPLQSWMARKKAFNKQNHQRNKLVRAHWRSQRHSIRIEVEQEVVDTAFRICSDLAAVIAWRLKERRRARLKDRAPPIILPSNRSIPEEAEIPFLGDLSAKIDSLLEALDETYRDHTDKAIAAHNTVARVLIWASKEKVYTGRQYWPYLPLRPLDPSPFIPGIFQAAEQLRLLRSEFDSLGVRNLSEDEFALAKAALAIVIFSGVDDREVLEGLFLEHCVCRRVPAIPDALLVRVDSLKYVVAMRGPGALAYSRWRQLGKLAENPECINDALRQVFCENTWTNTPNLIERLTNTQEIVNRLERSPIANLSLRLKDGSTNLDPDQLDVVLGYVFEDTDLPPNKDRPDLSARVTEPKNTDDFIITVASEMKELRNLLSDAKRDIELPRTSQIFRYDKQEKPSERAKLIGELERFLDASNSTWYGHLWGAWAANELVRPKKTGQGKMALSSVRSDFHSSEKALTRALKRLVHNNKRAATPEDLEALYHHVLENTSSTNAGNICRILLGLHESAVLYLEAEEADGSDYWVYYHPNRRERSKVRNRIATSYQISEISKALVRHSHPDADLSSFALQDRRLILQASLAFHLAMASGARYAEILSRQTRDILLIAEDSALMVRPNSMTRLKTASARRLVDLSDRIGGLYRDLLKETVEAEKARNYERYHTRLWLFSDLEGRPVPSQKIRDVVNEVANSVLGRPFRWHSLRRRWACEKYCRTFLGLGLDDLSQRSGLDHIANEGIMTPRDLVGLRHQMGHAGHRMTIETYMHIPWIFQIRDQHAYWSADRLAACISITPESARVQLSRYKSEIRATDKLLTRYGQCMPRGLEKKPRFQTPTLDVSGRTSRYCLALNDLGHGISQADVRVRYAITQQEIDSMLHYSKLFSRRSGIAIGLAGKYGQIRLSKPPRLSEEAKQAFQMWQWIDDSELRTPYMYIVTTWADHITISRENRSLIQVPRQVDTTIFERISLKAIPVGDDRVQVLADKKNVTSMVIWVMAITWIVDRSIESQAYRTVQQIMDLSTQN